jgi:hypothetical protein
MWRSGGVVTGAIVGALLCVLTAGSAQAAALAPSVAQARVGSTAFVQIKPLGHHQRTVVLTARGRAELNQQHVLGSRTVFAQCTRLGPEVRGRYPEESTLDEGQSIPGQPLHWETVLPRHVDFCDISLVPNTKAGFDRRSAGPAYASLALDDKGAAFLEDDDVTYALSVVATIVQVWVIEPLTGGSDHHSYPTPQQLLATLPSGQRLVVALARASATPPRESVGYYSNGHGRMSLVAVDPSGHRLFIEQRGDVESTNDAGHIERVDRFAPGYLPFYGGIATVSQGAR